MNYVLLFPLNSVYYSMKSKTYSFLFEKAQNVLAVCALLCTFARENQIIVSSMKKSVLIFVVAFAFSLLPAQAQLPAVTLKTMDGKEVRTDTLSNGGKPFIIDFFATWCKPCNRELDAISEVYDEWKEETGVKIFAVSIDQAQNINKVKPLVNNHGWEYEVLLDPNGDFKRALGCQMIPYVLIVNGKGEIVYKHNGYTDGAEEELIEKVLEIEHEE